MAEETQNVRFQDQPRDPAEQHAAPAPAPVDMTNKKVRPRWMLHVQAVFWRVLMGIGMMLHRLAPPRPGHPQFERSIPARVSERKGTFKLHFYTPRNYENQKSLGIKKYPVVINFHGGGFTLGSPLDDARWCKTVVDEVGAVVVSVDYRLAPEHPFPTAVEDGCDAIIYIAEHADELNIDVDRMAVSGFSSGGNMSFTVPLRLQSERLAWLQQHSASGSASDSSSNNDLAKTSAKQLLKAHDGGAASVVTDDMGKEIKLKAIVSWYPSTDYTHTREQRRMTCVRKDQELPSLFTDLFDESYLQPPTMDMGNPFLSPGVAPKEMLAELPEDIIMFTCEWDMLLAEGERLRDRLRDEVGKNIRYHMVPGVPHGWDKAPNPIKPTPGVYTHYLTACKELRKVLKSSGDEANRRGRRRSSVVN